MTSSRILACTWTVMCVTWKYMEIIVVRNILLCWVVFCCFFQDTESQSLFRKLSSNIISYYYYNVQSLQIDLLPKQFISGPCPFLQDLFIPGPLALSHMVLTCVNSWFSRTLTPNYIQDYSELIFAYCTYISRYTSASFDSSNNSSNRLI